MVQSDSTIRDAIRNAVQRGSALIYTKEYIEAIGFLEHAIIALLRTIGIDYCKDCLCRRTGLSKQCIV